MKWLVLISLVFFALMEGALACHHRGNRYRDNDYGHKDDHDHGYYKGDKGYYKDKKVYDHGYDTHGGGGYDDHGGYGHGGGHGGYGHGGYH